MKTTTATIMIRISTILSIIVMIILAGCSSDATRKAASALAVAEEVMDERPDSALTLLSDSTLLPSDRRQKALYALLLTQARHKNFIDETNDSLIATAVDYFDKHNDNPRLMKSLFYQATINSNAANHPSAMTTAMRADKIAKDLNDIYWQARIAELMGHIFSETYLYEEAIEHFNKSAALFKETNITNEYLYNLGDIAINYLNLRNYRMAIIFADSIRKQTNSPYLLSYRADILTSALYNLGRYEDAKTYADTLLSYNDVSPLTSLNYSKIALIELELGDISNAKKMLDKASAIAISPNDTLNYNLGLLKSYELVGKTSDAYSILEKTISQQNYIAREIRKQSSVVAQRDFFSQEAKDAELKAEKRKYSIILMTTVFLAVIIIVIILFKNKIKRKDAEIGLKVAQIQHLTSSIDTNVNTIKHLSGNLDDSHKKQIILSQLSQSLLQKRLKQLNMLVNEFYEKSDTPESRKAIFKNIEKEIARLTDNKNLTEIEGIVNSCMDDIIVKLREQLPDFSNDDISFLILTISGYGAKAISLFTGIKPNSTYMKRTRLIDKIAKSDAPDKDWFISKITGTPS